jgi:hypothetical protein
MDVFLCNEKKEQKREKNRNKDIYQGDPNEEYELERFQERTKKIYLIEDSLKVYVSEKFRANEFFDNGVQVRA